MPDWSSLQSDLASALMLHTSYRYCGGFKLHA